jgi:hypothetical protein
MVFGVLALLVATMPHLTVAAQGASGKAGSGSGDQTRAMDQDQLRDPTLHDGTVPDQLQIRARDQTNGGVVPGTTTPPGDQDRTQLRDQDRLHATTSTDTGANAQVQLRDQDQTRLMRNEHASTTQQLQLMIREEERALSQAASTGPVADQTQAQNGNRVRLAVHALIAADDLLGPIGPRVAAVATQLQEGADNAAATERTIAERGFWTRFFFGGDEERAQTLASVASENTARITELKKMLSDDAITEELRTTLMSQLDEAAREQTRLAQVATDERTTWGIFSWRF